MNGLGLPIFWRLTTLRIIKDRINGLIGLSGFEDSGNKKPLPFGRGLYILALSFQLN